MIATETYKVSLDGPPRELFSNPTVMNFRQNLDIAWNGQEAGPVDPVIVTAVTGNLNSHLDHHRPTGRPPGTPHQHPQQQFEPLSRSLSLGAQVSNVCWSFFCCDWDGDCVGSKQHFRVPHQTFLAIF